MDRTWAPIAFEQAFQGVSSAVQPDLLPVTQFAWGINADFRGSKPATRPNIAQCMYLPTGLYQGGSYFGVQNGMIVIQVAGRLFRLRIGSDTFSYEIIPLEFNNSGIIKEVWMTQTVETLVIQDGQSDAILYNGSSAVRAGPTQVPRGRMMAYGNGRLWVVIGTRQLVAGDIRTELPGSELYFTEATYLSGGGKLFFPRPITALAFNSVTGTTDYGTLMVFSSNFTQSVRADITKRSLWANYPGFITNVLRTVGCAGQRSVTEVNQDMYFRDANGGIRSLNSALQDQNGPGSAPISREVSRLTDYDSQQLLPFCSSIYFDNRLLVASSPYKNEVYGVSHKDLISLDFAPQSTMQGKTPPAYNGTWQGIRIAQMFTGNFNGRQRAFAVSSDTDGQNRLWEFNTRDRYDLSINCADDLTPSPIQAAIELPRVNFGSPMEYKRLERCDVWLSDISGDVEMQIYWRSDNAQKWNRWDDAEMCAQVTDPATNTPHSWKNLLPQERVQIRSYTIPQAIEGMTETFTQTGFFFQIRVVWTGKCRIQRVMLWASRLSVTDYADRVNLSSVCIENDVSGNQLVYQIPLNPCPQALTTIEVVDESAVLIPDNATVDFGDELDPEAEVSFLWTINNTGDVDLVISSMSVIGTDAARWTFTPLAETTIPPDGSQSFTITFTNLESPESAQEFAGTLRIVSNADNPIYLINMTARSKTTGGDYTPFTIDSRECTDVMPLAVFSGAGPTPPALWGHCMNEGEEPTTNSTSILKVNVTPGSDPVNYQWQYNNGSWTDIPEGYSGTEEYPIWYGGTTTDTLAAGDEEPGHASYGPPYSNGHVPYYDHRVRVTDGTTTEYAYFSFPYLCDF